MIDENKIKKVLYIFIVLHVLLFSTVALFRLNLPIDAIESIQWGSLTDFGTNKHPPLAGWLAYFVYNIFKTDYSIYLLGQAFIALGFIYIYKISRLFLDVVKSTLATMLTASCFIYSYITPYEGFDPNFILLSFLPVVIYYFYKSIKENKTKDWVILGLFAGLSFMGKYQSVMLFAPLFLYLIIEKDARKNFKNPKFYMSAIIAFLVVLPHIIWLFRNDFFSFEYFIKCERDYGEFIQSNFKYIIAPVQFLFEQFIAVISAIFIFFSAKLIFNRPIGFNKGKYPDNLFVAMVGIMPVILQALPGLFNGASIMATWGYELLCMTGIMLFYFIPFELNKKAINYIVSFVFLTITSIFIALGIIFATEKGETNRFPVEYVNSILKQEFKNQTNSELKYLAGYDRYTILLTQLKTGLKSDIPCWGHKNPWLSKEELFNKGFIAVDEKDSELINKITKDFPEVDINKVQIKTLEYKVQSFAKRERKYNLFYAIIQPKEYSTKF